ncbi:MAG: deiodinase-like protein [Planctomycetota bacterium]
MRSAGQLKQLHKEYGSDVAFFFVYCREAHPVDGNSPNAQATVEDPLTTEERRGVAAKFVAEVGFAMPALLDQVDDAVSKAYASHPDRLYLIGRNGKVAFAGDRGPMGFKPNELRKAIETELGGKGDVKGEGGGEGNGEAKAANNAKPEHPITGGGEAKRGGQK